MIRNNMKFLLYILLNIYAIFSSNSLNLPTKNYPTKVFVRLELKHMTPILNTLSTYTTAKFSQANSTTKEMFASYCQKIREAQYFMNAQPENLIYIGWIPLMNDARMIKFRDYKKPRRNDNIDIPYRKVPTYFIFIEPNDQTNTLIIQKIINNPTIDIDIDVSELKKDLVSMAKDINATLDFNPLKSFDNGRWFLILSESKMLECTQ